MTRLGPYVTIKLQTGAARNRDPPAEPDPAHAYRFHGQKQEVMFMQTISTRTTASDFEKCDRQRYRCIGVNRFCQRNDAGIYRSRVRQERLLQRCSFGGGAPAGPGRPSTETKPNDTQHTLIRRRRCGARAVRSKGGRAV